MMDYKKILEGVINIINTTEKSDIGFNNICAYIGEYCPELKESEDEKKIRKELIEHINRFKTTTLSDFKEREYDSWIAWIEKQSHTKKDIDNAYLKGVTDTKNEIEKQYEADYQIRKDIATFIFNYRGDIKDRAKWMDYLGIKVSFVEKQDEPNPYSGTSFEYNGHTFGMCARDGGAEILMDGNLKAFISLDKSFIYPVIPIPSLKAENIPVSKVDGKIYDMTYNSADKVKPKFKVGDTMRTLQEAANGYIDGMPVIISIDKKYYHCTNELIDIKDQDNYEYPPMNRRQKSVDTPKFKVGDFIVNDYCMGKVIELTNDAYLLDSGQGIPFSCEHNAHIWTIEDARDGDVLVHNDCTFIFMGIKNGIVQAIEENLTDGTNPVCFGDINGKNDYHPATKEQHDLLFQKIKEAGYEFNFEKKELKEIEQSPTCNAKDEEMLENVISSINQESIMEGLKSRGISYSIESSKHLMKNLIDWLKSLKPQLKNEWSKEDERVRNTTLSFLYEFKRKGYENAVECIDWLKSLKPQNRWKLDVDQLDALHDMIASYEVYSKDHNKEKISELVESLYYSLEKLKGE